MIALTLLRPRLLVLPCVLGLATCVAPPYLPPTDGPLAKIRMKVDHDSYAVTYDLHTQGACVRTGHTLGLVGSSEFVRNDFAQKNYVPIGMMGSASEASTYTVERTVRANAPIYLSVHAVLKTSVAVPVISSNTCSQVIEFMPIAGKEYEIRHSLSGKQCLISVDLLTIDSGTLKRAPVSDVKQHKCS